MSICEHLSLVYLGVSLPDHGLSQDVVNDLVGNGLAGSHQLVKLHASVGAGHDFSAKEVSGGDVGEGELHVTLSHWVPLPEPGPPKIERM